MEKSLAVSEEKDYYQKQYETNLRDMRINKEINLFC